MQNILKYCNMVSHPVVRAVCVRVCVLRFVSVCKLASPRVRRIHILCTHTFAFCLGVLDDDDDYDDAAGNDADA